MTQKNQVIQAIKECNFQKLSNLLDDKISYQDVSKNDFIYELKTTIKNLKIQKFDSVINGTCNLCQKGCSMTRFLVNRDEFIILDLFIQGTEYAEDIFQCHSNSLEDSDYSYATIDLHFDGEQNVNFKPTEEYLKNKKVIKKALMELKGFDQLNYITFNQYSKWYEKFQAVIEITNAPFDDEYFKIYDKLDSSYLTHLYNFKKEELFVYFSKSKPVKISNNIYSFKISKDEFLTIDISR